MRAFLFALCLADCAARTPPAPAAVPVELQSCPPTPAAVPVPPKPRTFEAIVAWGNASDARRAETAHALEVCRARLAELRAWVEGR